MVLLFGKTNIKNNGLMIAIAKKVTHLQKKKAQNQGVGDECQGTDRNVSISLES